jgi:hypothetical protein
LGSGSRSAAAVTAACGVSSGWWAARRLYRSLGFEPYGVEPRGLACAGRYFDQELLVLLFDREG